MIKGIGVDIVQIPRIENLIEKYGDKFLARILSKAEFIDKKCRCSGYVARRFAAKEAVFKALGTGAGRPYRFTDVSIVNNHLGKPEVVICGESRNKKFHLSLSDDYPVAAAYAIIEEE